jgi:hypothetical protein
MPAKFCYISVCCRRLAGMTRTPRRWVLRSEIYKSSLMELVCKFFQHPSRTLVGIWSAAVYHMELCRFMHVSNPVTNFAVGQDILVDCNVWAGIIEMRPWCNVGASCSLQAFDQRGLYGTMYLGMGSCHGTF